MNNDLFAVRRAIDLVDEQLVLLIAARAALVGQAWGQKDLMDVSHFDPNREAAILAAVQKRAESLQLPPDKIRAIWQQLIGLTPKS